MSRSRQLADLLDANGDVKLSNMDNSTALPLAGGAMTGAITTNSTFDGVDIATRDAILTSTTTTAGAALPKAGGAMTGAITTNSTFDGVDIATRDAVLTSTTTTANAALPKAGGAMTGAITTNSTFDGVDIATRDAILTSTTTTADAALPKAGGAMTGAITTNSTFDGVDVATRDAVLTSTTTTADAALPKAGGAMTGAITTNSTFDGVDVATRDGVLTSTTTTANAALPKAGGTMTGDLILGDDVKVEIGSASGGDLQLYHDGTNSYIDNVTGLLTLRINGTENAVQCTSNGSVAMMYDGAQKFATSANGVSVTGNAVGTMTTDNDGSFDMSASNNFKCTPSGGFTLTFTNIVAQSGNILLINSGGHTVAAHANTKVDANILATISAAGTYLLAYFSDGTNAYMTNSAIYT